MDPLAEKQDFQARLYRRSLFPYVLMNNRLPQAIVDLPSVRSFQSKLSALAKYRAQTDQEGWRRTFQDCDEIVAMFYSNNEQGTPFVLLSIWLRDFQLLGKSSQAYA